MFGVFAWRIPALVERDGYSSGEEYRRWRRHPSLRFGQKNAFRNIDHAASLVACAGLPSDGFSCFRRQYECAGLKFLILGYRLYLGRIAMDPNPSRSDFASWLP